MVSLYKQTDQSLAQFVVTNGLVSDEQMRQAKELNEAVGSGIIDCCLNLGFFNEEQLLEKFCENYGLQRCKTKLATFRNRPLKENITDQFIIKNRVVPVDSVDDKVYVAVADPSSLEAFNSMQIISNTSLVEASVVTLSDMNEYLERLKSRMDDDFLKSLESGEFDEEAINYTEQEAGNAAGAIPDYLLTDQEQEETKKKSRITASTDVIQFVDTVLSEAIAIGVSDIHIESFRDTAKVRYRKDGVMQTIDDFSEFLTFNYSAVITRVKILASLDISERRLPQDGAITSDLADKTVDIRVSILPTVHGERVVMRILDPEAANFTLDELGIPEHNLNKFRKAIHAPQGMVLVTGPTGSGKSTTLYAGLKELNDPGVNILTAEDPVEYDLSGVGQVQVKNKIGFTFASALRSFLRQDPEIIMVGEIRDKETADIAIKAALTGHLVLSTLHTNDSISTLTRLSNMGIPPYLITSALSLVVAQRLARVNCPHCIEEDKTITPDILRDAGFSEEEIAAAKPQHSKGCDRCMDTGVKGRVGIHEILAVNNKIKDALLKGKNEIEIQEIAKQDGFETMQSVGKRLINSGKISVAEYKRVLVLD